MQSQVPQVPPSQTSQIPPIDEKHAPSFFMQHKFTILSGLILLFALIPLVILTQMHKNAPPSLPQQAMTNLTPTPVPLTPQNVLPTIDSTDQSIQNALDASQTQVNSAAQIDASDDSTVGL